MHKMVYSIHAPIIFSVLQQLIHKIIIIVYFENVAFLHAKLGSDVCPWVDNQTSGDTSQESTRSYVRWVNLGSQVLPVNVCKVTQFKTWYNFFGRFCAVIGYTKRPTLREGFSD